MRKLAARSLFVLWASLLAWSQGGPPRVVNDNDVVPVTGSVHPLAQPQNDQGLASAGLPMQRMILVLSARSGTQSTLQTLIAAQHDPKSPQYHHWLTPDQFGTQFGLSDDDLTAVQQWLLRQGFSIDEVARSRAWINFSGTVGQVESAFHTQIRNYLVNGELHHANATPTQIPRGLSDIVVGVSSLHDFRRQGQHSTPQAVPQFTSGTSHYLAPADFATIYNVNPLYSASINGSGQTIAIVGRTDILLSDVQTFRSYFGLPANDPVFVHNGTDPGDVGGGEETEADLDVEWSGAVAPNATIKFVISKSTLSTDGVDLSAQYIVNNNVAPVMSTSFGQGETCMTGPENSFYNNLWSQAASQGITAFVSSGDSGPAECDSGSSTRASGGLTVNGLCSPPFSVCVGGTQFNDTSNPSQYWSSTNDSTTKKSVLGVIPEIAWNESGTVSGGSGLWSSGGGVSALYSKPSWQTGTGVPADGKRDTPDVSLSAASHDGYLIFQGAGLYAVGGTSAASPSFAGLMGLINQKTGSSQGNANTVFYAMAGTSAFRDITTGNNIIPKSPTGTFGYTTNVGYDLVTGLGSVDAAVLVNNWSSFLPDFAIGASPASVTVAQGASGPTTITTTVSNGFASAVTLSATGMPAGVTVGFAPNPIASPGSGSSTMTITVGASVTLGTYSLTVTGTGGGKSHNTTVSLTVGAPPDFTIGAAPTTVTVAQGAQGTSSITTTVSNGFSNAVTLSATGMPAGVTVGFAPNPIAAPGSGSSTLTITVGASVTVGTYPLTVKGTGGSLNHTTTVNLTVTTNGPPAVVSGFPVQALGTASTAARNSTGATLLVIGCGSYSGACTISDSAANTWTPLSACGTGIPRQQFFYVLNPVTSAAHTFAATSGVDTFVQVWAFSGAASGFDTQVCNPNAASNSFTVGTLTPAQGNEVLITQAVSNGFPTSGSINGGFGGLLLQTAASVEVGGGASLIDVSGAAVNPTWTFNTGQPWAASIVAFKGNGGGGGGGGGTVATPTDLPGAGSYATPQSVTLSDTTAGSAICYTTDGTIPTATVAGTCDGSTYSTSFLVSNTATVRAIATKAGMTNSTVLTSSYVITNGSAPSSMSGFPVQALGIASTAARDTRGATLLVIGCGSYDGTCTIGDSVGNNWSALATCGTAVPFQRFFYALNPVTSAVHTFAATSGMDTFVQVWAFTGAAGGFDTQVCNPSAGSNSFAVGTLTPAQGNEVLITQAVSNGFPTSGSINGGFGGLLLQTAASVEVGGGASLIDVSGAAVNPTWTFNTGQPWAASIVAFKGNGGGGGGGGGTVATPTDLPGAGSYATSQSVTLSDGTAGATICYSVDGTMPTATVAGTCDGNTYSTSFLVSNTATVRAIATKSGMTNSSVLTSSYVITNGSAPAALSGFPVQALGIASTGARDTRGATLLVIGCGSYSGACTISDSAANTWTPLSACGTGIPRQQFFYVLNPVTNAAHTFAATSGVDTFVQVWAFSGAAGGFDTQVCNPSAATNSFTVGTLTPAQGNEVLITQAVSNGFPTTGSINGGFGGLLLQTAASVEVGGGASLIDVSGSAVNPSWTFNTGQPWAASIVAFKGNGGGGGGGGGTVATPTDLPGAGSYATPQTVTLNTATAGATICYSVDGTMPTASVAGTCDGTAYATPFLVSNTATVRAIATKSGMTNSSVLTSSYIITNGSAPAALGGFPLQALGIASTAARDTRGATLLVIGCGSYSGPCTISDSAANTWSPLAACGTGFPRQQFFSALNPVTSAAHTFAATSGVDTFVQVWAFSGAAGGFDTQVCNPSAGSNSFTMGTLTPAQGNEVLITQAVSNGFPTTGSINGGFGGLLLQTAAAVEVGGGASLIDVSGSAVNPSWTFNTGQPWAASIVAFKGNGGGGGGGTVATPTDLPGAGTYATAQTVSLGDTTAGSAICYTTDGTMPTASVAGTCDGTTYSTPFLVSNTTTVRAIATKAGMTNSTLLTSSYSITNGSAPAALSGFPVQSTKLVNTAARDTRGATLLVIGCGTYDGSCSINDSAGNIWTPLPVCGTTVPFQQFFYAVNPVTSSAHTFVANGFDAFLQVWAFSGAAGGFDTQTCNAHATSDSFAVGTLTPAQANEVLITQAVSNGFPTSGSIDSGFGGLLLQTWTAVEVGGGASLIDVAGTAVNPNWTFNTGQPWAASVVAFKK